jgi:hypothetical protein
VALLYSRANFAKSGSGGKGYVGIVFLLRLKPIFESRSICCSQHGLVSGVGDGSSSGGHDDDDEKKIAMKLERWSS